MKEDFVRGQKRAKVSSEKPLCFKAEKNLRLNGDKTGQKEQKEKGEPYRSEVGGSSSSSKLDISSEKQNEKQKDGFEAYVTRFTGNGAGTVTTPISQEEFERTVPCTLLCNALPEDMAHDLLSFFMKESNQWKQGPNPYPK